MNDSHLDLSADAVLLSNPDHMTSTCKGTWIAYLKGPPPDDGRPILTLAHEDNPVIRPYLQDLHICYLVDEGESYSYIQNRHLEE